VSSFVFHSSLLSVYLVVARDGFLCVTRNPHIFIVAALITDVLFQQFLFVMLCNVLNIANREGNAWIVQFQTPLHTLTEARGSIVLIFSHSSTFEQFLIRTAV